MSRPLKPATYRQIQNALSDIPALRSCNRRNETAPDMTFNCFSYTLGETHRLWDPGMTQPPYYWPPGVPDNYHLSTLLMIVDRYGYKACADGRLAAKQEKIVFYISTRVPRTLLVTHAARQLPDGWWAHKFGEGIGAEIDDPDAVLPQYGHCLLFLQRPRSA